MPKRKYLKRWKNPNRQLTNSARDGKEKIFYKEKSRDLTNVTMDSSPSGAAAFRGLLPKETQMIHTHVNGALSNALPSHSDLNRGLVSRIEMTHFPSLSGTFLQPSNMRLYSISVISPKRKIEKGRTHIFINRKKFNKKFLSKGYLNKEWNSFKSWLSRETAKIKAEKSPKKSAKMTLNLLEEMKHYEIRARFWPAKGYRFDKKKGDYIKVKKRKLK